MSFVCLNTRNHCHQHTRLKCTSLPMQGQVLGQVLVVQMLC